MKYFVVLLLAWFTPTLAWAANGSDWSFTLPANTPTPTYSCIDLCNIDNPNASQTCGPIFPPVPDAAWSEFRVVATTTPACAFDTVDVIAWNTSTAPSSERTSVIGTLDDDGAVDCGLGTNIACHSFRVQGALFGYLYVTSNGATIGGASCTNWRLRLCQQPMPR